ncbi:MAG: carboxypeptidase regulatory-like domain-containing protein, partial [Bacteroidota bacterium]|nr:carboxypeptidase regulatory-like domain-containing protein [Bacteroidota bacterium]
MSFSLKISAFFAILLTVVSFQSYAQITSSQLTGRVINARGESIMGVGIRIHYLPDQSSYTVITRQKGLFNMENLPAGGPYEFALTCVGYDTLRIHEIYLSLGNNTLPDWILPDTINRLSDVTVRSFSKAKQTGILGGNRSVLDETFLHQLPAPGLQLSDYLRAVPNTRLRKGEEGAIGFGGQNNRYNSFYVDGAVQNDVFGLSASGTNGGQAGISPVSLESIEQIQVTLSPIDVSIGNFTGAGIQAVTKSGGNQWK